MALVGTLGSLSVAEILQTLAQSSANGILHLVGPHGKRSILLQDGIVIQALHPDERDGVLQALAAHGHLPNLPTHLPQDASLIDLLGQLLSAAQLTKRQVQDTLSKQVAEELLTILDWDHGSFAFHEAADDPEIQRRLLSWQGFGITIDLAEWLPAQQQLFQQWQDISSQIDQRSILRFSSDATSRVNQHWPEQVLFSLIDGARSFTWLVNEAPIAAIRSRLLLAQWIAEGVIEAIPASELPSLAESCLPGNPDRAAHLAQGMFGTPQSAQGEAILQRALTDLRQPQSAAEHLMGLAMWRLDEGMLPGAERLMRQALAKLQQDDAGNSVHLQLWTSRWWSCCIAGGNQQEALRGILQSGRDAVERKQALLASVRAQQARMLSPLDPAVNNFVIEIQTNNDLRHDHIVCHGCGREVIATATECPYCRAELELSCADCGRPVADRDDCCLACQAGLTPDRPLRLVGSFVARLRHELSDEPLAQAEEALRLQSEGEHLLAIRFWRQLLDIDAGTDELRQLIAQRIEQLQSWYRRQQAVQHLDRGRLAVGKRHVLRGWLAYRKAKDWLPEHDSLLPLLVTEQRQTNRILALTAAAYALAISFTLLAIFELQSKPTVSHEIQPEEITSRPPQGSVPDENGQASDTFAQIAVPPETVIALPAAKTWSQQLANLAAQQIGHDARWSLSIQEWLLGLCAAADEEVRQKAQYRLRLRHVEALAAYHFLPKINNDFAQNGHVAILPDQQPFIDFLTSFSGTIYATEVSESLQQLKKHADFQQQLQLRYETAVSQDDFFAAQEAWQALTKSGIHLDQQGYVIPVVIDSGNNSAFLTLNNERIRDADASGYITWWADPATDADVTLFYPGYNSHKIHEQEWRSGVTLRVLPKPIHHVYASTPQPLRKIWPLLHIAEQSYATVGPYLALGDEDIFLIDKGPLPEPPPQSTSLTSIAQTTLSHRWHRFLEPSIRSYLSALPSNERPSIHYFNDGSFLHPWQNGLWQLVIPGQQQALSWPRRGGSIGAPDAPCMWPGNQQQMVSWHDGDGIRIGPWRGELHRMAFASAIIAGPKAQPDFRKLFLATHNNDVVAIDPIALRVLWQVNIPNIRSLLQPQANSISVLTGRSLINLRTVDGAEKWRVPASWLDTAQVWQNQWIIHEHSDGDEQLPQVLVRRLEDGHVEATIAGELILLREQDAVFLRPDGSISGWRDGNWQWQTDGPAKGNASNVVAWLNHHNGFFAVLDDGRWISYHIP